MATIGQAVRQWRLGRGLSQPRLARQLGISQQSLQQLEAGEIKSPRYLLALARAMGVAPEPLLEGRLQPADPPGLGGAGGNAVPAAPVGLVGAGQRDLPVYTSAQAGPEGMLVSYDPIEWIERPALLAGVPGAFAMYVVNDSMEPRYRQGDLLLIHPQRPVRRGKDVLVIKLSERAEHEAYVKELISVDSRKVLLRQLNPEGLIEIDRNKVFGLHLVVGVYYGG